jgi:hypothetical protein
MYKHTRTRHIRTHTRARGLPTARYIRLNYPKRMMKKKKTNGRATNYCRRVPCAVNPVAASGSRRRRKGDEQKKKIK